MSDLNLRQQQEHFADDALASFSFGEGLTMVGSASWQVDSFDGKDDWTKLVYVECDDDAEGASSHRISLHVAFVQGSTTISEVYAYWCENGAEIGSPGDRLPVVSAN